MVNSLKFNNVILMLKEEDRGFGNNKPPAGYVRLEIRDGKGKISAMVQDLKDSDEQNNYHLYLIKYHEEEICPALIGTILVKNGRGEIIREFDPLNVGDTKLHINNFNIGIVILERKGTDKTDIKCPLVSYKDKKVRWKEIFEKYFRDLEEDLKLGGKIKHEGKVREKAKENFLKEDSYEVDESSEKVEEIEKAEEAKEIEGVNKGEEVSVETENAKIRNESDDIKTIQDTYGDIYSKYTGVAESKYSFTENIPEKNPDTICENCIYKYKNILNEDREEESVEDENIETINQETVSQEVTNITKQTTANQGITSQEVNSQEAINKEIVSEEATIHEMVNQQTKVAKTYPDINLLENCLDKVFKRCDPFNTRRRDYKWWKIHSPVYLSDVLQYCNIYVPKIFNPSIIMAYYKYRYLIAGIYTSRRRGKEYIVYGIPGTYNIDESPLGDLCKWIQVERTAPKYGAFGYWIAYIDPNTGELIKVS